MKNNHPTYIDNRGSFTSILLNQNDLNWDQVSISINEKPGTFRGLHYQTNPKQIKYIKVVQGKIIDILYDLNTKEVSHFLVDNQSSVFVESDKAHGFITLEPNTIVTYLIKGNYDPMSEHSIVWHTIDEVKEIVQDNLRKLNVDITISEKDEIGK
jgi:dTDP-4-dehydrorhamnose 3,5-epimerase